MNVSTTGIFKITFYTRLNIIKNSTQHINVSLTNPYKFLLQTALLIFIDVRVGKYYYVVCKNSTLKCQFTFSFFEIMLSFLLGKFI